MFALRIVEHLDVVEHILSGVRSCLVVSASCPLSLEQVEEALGNGIVVTVPVPAYRVFQIVMLQERCPVHTGELRTLIGVDEHLALRLPTPYSHE